MRIIGLDVGDKRIGVALSDELGWTAQGLTVLERSELEKDIAAIGELIERYGVVEVIVGLPRRLDGSSGPQARKVMAFVEALRDRLSVPVKTWDERFTTVAAEKLLVEADVSRAGRKKVIDKMAASLLLQSYLYARR